MLPRRCRSRLKHVPEAACYSAALVSHLNSWRIWRMPSVEKSKYEVGSLVLLRGREWVVIPSDGSDVIRLRPLSGREEETIGVHTLLEENHLKPATFPEPDPSTAGDFIGGKLLRNAARLSLRSGAGPFRSLGRISVRPRPYQFVPLIMALRLNTVRLFIADDVGIGKTIEAGMIVKELLDRGEQRDSVSCARPTCASNGRLN